MASEVARRALAQRGKSASVLAALTASLMMGGCAQVGMDAGDGLLSVLGSEDGAQQPAQASTEPTDPRALAEYWGKEYNTNPTNVKKAVSYARSLKALGEKRQALSILQQAATLQGEDKELASEYGRLALELDQVSVAKRALEVADDPANPDWRVIMARGTVLAKEGHYRDAIPFFERARSLSSDHPSVVSNLALAYTMNGEVQKGEDLLRVAAANTDASSKVHQNLALVLGLQGKYQEATQVASTTLAPEEARANSDVLRKIVKLDEQKSAPKPAALPAEAWVTQVSEPSAAQSPAKSAEGTPAPSQSIVRTISARPGDLGLKSGL